MAAAFTKAWEGAASRLIADHTISVGIVTIIITITLGLTGWLLVVVLLR